MELKIPVSHCWKSGIQPILKNANQGAGFRMFWPARRGKGRRSPRCSGSSVPHRNPSFGLGVKQRIAIRSALVDLCLSCFNSLNKLEICNHHPCLRREEGGSLGFMFGFVMVRVSCSQKRCCLPADLQLLICPHIPHLWCALQAFFRCYDSRAWFSSEKS